MKKIIPLATIATLMALGGCASTQFAGYSTAHLAQVGIIQHPRANNGVVPEEARTEIVYLNHSCQDQIGPQAAGFIQSAASGAIINGPPQALGLTGAYSVLAPSIAPLSSAGAGLITGVVGGAVNGAMQGAASAASAIGECTGKFWEMDRKYDWASPEGVDFKKDIRFEGTGVVTIYAGKAFGAPYTSAPGKKK